MRKLLFALAFLAGTFALGAHARAACATSYPYGPPNYLVNGVTAAATTLWADLQDVRTCATTVDNTQIGPLGVFASQMIPTTVAQATFGGSQAYTFPSGLNVLGTLLVNGGAVPSVSSANVWTAAQTINAPLNVNSGTLCTNAGDICAARSATTGEYAMGTSTENGDIDYGINNAHAFSFTCGGASCTVHLFAGGSIAPMYTTAGASTAAAHSVFISTTTAGSTSACGDAGTQYCSTVNLSGAAAFSAYNSFQCNTNTAGATPSMGEYYGAVTTGYGESHASGTTIKFWSASPSQAMVAVCTGT